MRVLLLSRNRVVQELVKLGSGALEEIELEIVAEPSELKGDRYDLILLDERYIQEKGAEAWEHLIAGWKVLLGSGGTDGTAERFDEVLEKPFLPGDIRRLLERSVPVPAESEETSELDDFIAFLNEEEAEESVETEVLDREELLRIRCLLNEAEPEESLPEPTVETKRGYELEEFLELLERSKVKKLKKLLRGARIHVTIEFPEEG